MNGQIKFSYSCLDPIFIFYKIFSKNICNSKEGLNF